MAKIIQFRPKRTLRLEPRISSGNCPRCHHKMNVHITHPNGVSSCAARGCNCESRPTGEWPKA